MFSGIVEAVQPLLGIEKSGTNLIFTVAHKFDEDLYIDQSISHNGVCLTVIEILDHAYKVEAIKETLDLSNLSKLDVGSILNLERSIKIETRLDGHVVQGHVDGIAELISVKDEDGSWVFEFKIPADKTKLIIHKGSITINGISLTVSSIIDDHVSVAIIPYTYKHTNLHTLSVGDMVNIEYDLFGKYMMNYMQKINA